jgi:hypothetical protein
MSDNQKSKSATKPLLSWMLATLAVYSGLGQAAESDRTKIITDIKPPFAFSIKTLTPDGEPQPGVKIKCVHPRSQRGAAIVDMLATSDEKGVAAFKITKADLALDRYFWFSMADENFAGHPGVGISPIDNEYTYTFKVLPAEKYRILVLDEDDKPVADAKLWLSADHPAFPGYEPDAFIASDSITTNTQGLANVTFARIDTNVIASAKGLASAFIRGASLPKDEPFVVRLSPGCDIAGQVVGPDKNPVANVELSAKQDDFIMNYMDVFILKAITDAEGKFVLKNAAKSTYEIQALMQEPHEALYAKPVSVNVEGDSPITGVKILAERGAVLKGRYVTKHQLTIADRDIFVATFSPLQSNWRIRTRQDGSFAISGIPQDTHGMIDFIGVSGYYTSLTMSKAYPFFQLEGRNIRFRNVPPGIYEGVEVEFLLAGRATGTVIDPSGNPMPNQELVVRPGGRIYKTNDRGEYTAEIPPDADVTIEVRNSSSRQTIFHCEPFKLAEGEVIEKNLNLGSVSSRLVGKSLPGLEGIDIEFDVRRVEGGNILVCFFDMNQRPSRNCIIQLAKQADQLKEKGVTIVAVQASEVDENTLGEWVKKNSIPFPVGMIQGDEEQTRSTWGVKSLPWLILTDHKHIVQAEVSSIADLDEKLRANK